MPGIKDLLSKHVWVQRCVPDAPLTGDAVLGSSRLLAEYCQDAGTDMRKSFPSGHSSSSAVLMVYNVRCPCPVILQAPAMSMHRAAAESTNEDM